MRTHFYALHNNNGEWTELLEHEIFFCFQMHSEDNLAVMSYYSHIIQEIMFIHLGLNGLSIFGGYALDSVI